MMRLNLLVVLLILTSCASTYHEEVEKELEESKQNYAESKQRTEDAIKKKNKEKVRVISVDLDELNKEIDNENLLYRDPAQDSPENTADSDKFSVLE